MKKNKFLKIAGAIFTMCLMTTCAIGTTFAKYTTGSTASDTARVAKWGVEVSTSGTMFGKFYGANTAGANQDSIIASASGSVDTSTTDKIVAPGTKNETGIQIKIAGQPEVAFKVDAEGTVASEIFLGAGEYGVMIEAFGINAATDFYTEVKEGTLYTLSGTTYTKATAFVAGTKYYRLTNYVNVTARYNPIVWTGTVVSTATEGEPSGTWTAPYATLTDAVNALTSQIDALGNNGTFEANDNVNNVYTLTWAWAFEGQNDVADTILGDLQANRSVVKLDGDTATAPEANTDYCLTINCNIGVTATQLN